VNADLGALAPPPDARSRSRLRRALPAMVFLEIPAVVVGTVVVYAVHLGMADFRAFWEAGRDVLDGRSPYPPLDAAVVTAGHGFVYPPAAAFAVAPFALLPYTAAATIFALLTVASVLLTLWVLGVRDRRCYGLAVLPASTLSVVGSGALSAFLALGLALAWRFRDRLRVAVPAIAVLVIAKLLLWPVLVWLLATRRWAAAAGAVVAGALATTAAWAAIGFAGTAEYPHLLGKIARLEQVDGYSLVALGHGAGLGTGAARAAAAVVGGALLIATVLVARRPLGDRRSFILAIAASLALSPVVWLHYFVLLLVPLALARPRFAPLWLLPLAFWLCPIHSGGVLWRVLLGVGIAALVFGRSMRRRPAIRIADPASALPAGSRLAS
jgi:alpha-1,2-mannosyltransferase